MFIKQINNIINRSDEKDYTDGDDDAQHHAN